MTHPEVAVAMLLSLKINPRDRYEIRAYEAANSERVHKIAFLVREILTEASDKAGISTKLIEHVPTRHAGDRLNMIKSRARVIAASDVSVVVDPTIGDLSTAATLTENALRRVFAVFSTQQRLMEMASAIGEKKLPLAEGTSEKPMPYPYLSQAAACE